jgi:hypothetical protein
VLFTIATGDDIVVETIIIFNKRFFLIGLKLGVWMKREMVFINYVTAVDHADYAYGRYYIDTKTEVILFAPIDPEKAQKAQKIPIWWMLWWILNLLLVIMFAQPLYYAIISTQQISKFYTIIILNILWLLAPTVIVASQFCYIRKKHGNRLKMLENEAGYHNISISGSKEKELLEQILKVGKKQLALFVVSLTLAPATGLLFIMHSYIILWYTALIPIIIVCALLPFAKDAYIARAHIKKRLRKLEDKIVSYKEF